MRPHNHPDSPGGPAPVHQVSTHAVLVDLPDLASTMAWHAALRATPLPGQTSVLAAARTVLVQFDTPGSASTARATLPTFSPDQTTSLSRREITVEVRYDGEDLHSLASELGMSSEALINHHLGTTWVAAFSGFAPGFTYCVPQSGQPLSVPRLASPRTVVPHGAVALAGEFSAVYPRTSPGGWRLIGTTETPFWDTHLDPPALLSPGDLVRYRARTERLTVRHPSPAHSPATNPPHPEPASTPPAHAALPSTTPTPGKPALPRAPGRRGAPPHPAPEQRPVLRVEDTGLQTLIEDTGRPGFGDLGVTASGAADQNSANAANEALGNPRHAAVLENIGGLRLKALVDTTVVVTGAVAPIAVNGHRRELGVPALLTAGSVLTIGTATAGLRSYVGVRGGVVAESVLGSSSTDILSGLGPAPVSIGDTIHAGPPTGTVSPVRRGLHTDGILRVVPGPRDDWFTGGVTALTDNAWLVDGASNRVGLRLAGDNPIPRECDRELPSEGMVAGSVQVPRDGKPIVFLRDHAVTGGYPVIATVIPEDLDAAAQMAPGTQITFTTVPLVQSLG